MEIILVRHAKSAHDPAQWKTDAVRPLAPKGIKRQKAAATGMQKEGLEYTKIWVSPFVRAQETLDIIQEAYGTKIEPDINDELRVWGNPSKVRDLLDSHFMSKPDDKLLLVGHNPNMSDLVRILINQQISLSTSDVVHIDRDDTGYHLIKYYPRSELMK